MNLKVKFENLVGNIELKLKGNQEISNFNKIIQQN